MRIMPYVISQRVHLVGIVLLSMISFAYGFVSAFPTADVTEQADHASTDVVHANDAVASAPFPPDRASDSEGRSAVFSCVLRHPFESVLKAWENGPPDPNFIKEDVEIEFHGSEERKHKTIYVKNPLPFVVRKTVRRD